MHLKQINSALNRALSSTFYKKKLGKFHGRIESWDDFYQIPFTFKNEIRNSDPFDFITMPLSLIRRVHSSSGTKGTPSLTFYTDNDINTWHKHLHRAFKIAGLEPGDIFQTIVGFGMFSGGLGFQLAAESYGMMTIPIGTGNTERQVDFLKKFKVNGFITISSYLPVLINYMKEREIDPKSEMKLKAILIGAEPFNPSEKKEWEEFFGVPILGIYGMSEIEGPGIAYECPNGNGMHIIDEDFYIEIVNPQTGEPLPYGQEGEIVVTTLSRECMPLIRYRTGDISCIRKIQCCDEKEILKLDYVRRRTDDLFIIKGINVFPDEVENIIYEQEHINNTFQILIESGDRVTLLLSTNDRNVDKNAIARNIINEIKKWLYFSVSIKWVENEDLLRNTGKRKYVIDNRKTE